jgi:Tol biopolymer transport system component
MSGEKLYRIRAAGTTSTIIATLTAANTSGDLHVLAGAWGADDRIVLALWRGGLLEVSARGGTPVELMPASKELVDFHHLQFLPGGKELLAIPHRLDNEITAEVIRGRTRETILRLDEGSISTVAWSPTGHLVFERNGASSGIWAVPFDLRAMKTSGRPFIVAPGGGTCSASSDGSLIYVSDVDDRPGRVVRVDRSGKILRTFGEPADDVQSPLLSPDERTLAFASREEDNKTYIWLADAERGTKHRLSGGAAGEVPTDWSPDGRLLLATRQKSANWNDPTSGTWLYAADGAPPPKRIAGGWFASFTPDGRGAVLSTLGLRADSNLAFVPLDTSTPLVEFIRSPSNKSGPFVSPDGRYVAYTEVTAGERNVMIARFPAGDGRHVIAQGFAAHWSSDGRMIYFVDGNTVFAATFNAATGQSGAPAAIIDTAPLNITPSQVLRDGTFLGVQRLPSTRRHLILVQNWFAEFKDQPE